MRSKLKTINDTEIINQLNNSCSFRDCLRHLNCAENSNNINYLKTIIEKYNINIQFKQNNNINKHRNKKHKNNKKIICNFCNNLYSIYGIKLHEKYCRMNPNREICLGNKGTTKGYTAWNKGLTATINESVKKQAISLKQGYKSGRLINHNLGTHHTEEHKYKQRLGAIAYLEENKGFHKPRFNKKSGDYIEQLNKNKNWNLQYYANGGECKIYGYFVDGYDKDLNIVFEYDEARHYKDVYNNVLIDKDIERQNNIINNLHCQFWRYNERLNLLYQVN